MELVSVEDLKDLLYVRCLGQDKFFIKAMEEVIDECPRIDARPIVRCQNCIYAEESEHEGCIICTALGVCRLKSDFCSEGEEKE